MIHREHQLPVRRQAELLELSTSAVYYRPVAVSDEDLALMRRIDELHLEHPFAGSRMLKRLLQDDGFEVGRTHVRTLMRWMGVEALYRRPRTSQPHPGHRVFPYLLRGQVIDRPNQVWALDISVPQRAARKMREIGPSPSVCRYWWQTTSCGLGQKPLS